MKPNDFGKITVEDCERLPITACLKTFRSQMKTAFLKASLEAAGIKVGLTTTETGFGGIRHWFVCPGCGKRIGVILIHPTTRKVGCRECIGVEYRGKRFKGMLESDVYGK